VRALILDAARELFVANGYDATTTSEICLKAGVSERLLFTNFGSKSDLFKAAVVDPFTELIADYVASWEGDAPDSTPEARIEFFVDGLYDLAKRNRAILLSALSRRRTNRPEAEEGMLDELARLFQGMQGLAVLESEIHSYQVDPPATIAAAAAMVLGVVLLDELLFPAGTRRPGRDRMTAELTNMILHGVAHR
jgi:AcrR family transcriptional regulator